MKRCNISITDESYGGAGTSAGTINDTSREYTESGTEPKQKFPKSCAAVDEGRGGDTTTHICVSHLLLPDASPPNLSISFLGSGGNSKMSSRDENMSTTTTLPLSSVSSASGPIMGGTFNLNAIMRKIERAGSCNTWTKVAKSSKLLKQLIESFDDKLSSEQEVIIGTSVAKCMRCRALIPADSVHRNALIALYDVIESCVRPRILLSEWIASELSELLQRWKLSLSLFCDESFEMTAACKPVRAALLAVNDGNVSDDEEVKEQYLVASTTAVFMLRSAEEAGRLHVNLRNHVYELIKVARDRRLKFPEGPLRDAVDELTQGMYRELTKPQGLNERRTRTLESMAHPLRNKTSDVTR